MSGSGKPELEFELTLAELSRCCGVSAEKILVFVAEGILEPYGAGQRDWRFASRDLARARRALRLEHDLGVNAAGAALAIELIEEITEIRRRLDCLEGLQ